MTATILHGDCRELIATLPDNSIDAIVTDPPYELGFMGKKWDAAGIAYDRDLWAECLRVLKPGGHLLAFGGTRTYHRMTAAIEDAGFEIRDSIHWLYGSGFPKSLDVSKAIDKQRHDRAEVYQVTAWIRVTRDAAGISNRDIDTAFGANGMARHWTDVLPHGKQPAVPTLEQVPKLLDVLGVTLDDMPDDIRRLLWELNGRKGQPGENWAKREVVGARSVPVGHAFAGPVYGGDSSAKPINVTAPATDAARQWEGWGTALKPAHEPAALARKPPTGTVAANVLEHDTGALNIDGTRIGERWPANVVLDDHLAELHPDWAGYFYCSKASKAERNTAGPNNHPTVKPVALMRWLVRLVTPPGGTVLDPFAGSGTTLAAAILEGFDVIGCEMTDEYLPIIEGRVAWAQAQRENPSPPPATTATPADNTSQLDLFGDAA